MSLPRLLFALAAAAGSLPAFADDCSPVALERAAGDLAAPRAALQAAIGGNDLDPDISQATSDAIVTIKSRLAALIDAQVACAAPDTAALAKTLNTAIAGDKSGDAALLHVEPTLDRDRLSVVANIGIPCGSDTLWLVYEKRDGRWRRTLRWTSPPYRRVDKAWGAFQVALSPRDADGRWFALASHVRTWCTSSWSVVDYEIMRPGGNAPAVLLQGNDGIWSGFDDAGRINVDPTHAELRFRGRSIDAGVHNREYIRRWSVGVSAVKRIAPIASSPRDFVEEWIVLPWTQAKDWSAQPVLLEGAHRRLSAQEKRYSLAEFGPVMSCPSGDTQIELRHDDDSATFFRVTGDTTNYTIARIGDTADPDCAKEIPQETSND